MNLRWGIRWTLTVFIISCLVILSCNSEKKQDVSKKASSREIKNLSEEKTVLQDVICNKFEPSVGFNNDILTLSLDTDLPDDTRMIVTVKRNYTEKDNTATYTFDYYTDLRGPVSKWNEPRQITIKNSVWINNYKEKRAELQKLNLDINIDKIDQNIIVNFRIPTELQPDSIYTDLNRNLFGECVIDHGEGKAKEINWKKKLYFPIKL